MGALSMNTEQSIRCTFAEFVFKCAENKTLVSEFDRLTGFNLSMKGGGIERMIDDATGRTSEGVEQFVSFVHEFVWLPIAGKCDE
jgi:hypothetical protein